MNQKDRARMAELYNIVRCVPFPASGSQSTTIAGIAGYVEDMRELDPWIARLITGISLDGHPELEKGVDYDDPDLIIAAIQEWIKIRKQEQWQTKGLPQRIATLFEAMLEAATG